MNVIPLLHPGTIGSVMQQGMPHKSSDSGRRECMGLIVCGGSVQSLPCELRGDEKRGQGTCWCV